MDAFFASGILALLVLAVLGEPIYHVLLPFFSTQSDSEAAESSRAVTFAVAVVLAIVGGALALAAPHLAGLLVPGFDSAARSQFVTMARIQLVGAAFAGIAIVPRSLLQARGKFLRAAGAGTIAAGVALLLTIWLVPRYGSMSMAWIFLVRAVVECGALGPMVRLKWRASLKLGVVREVAIKAWPIIASHSYQRLDLVIERALASMAAPGILSLFAFAQQACGAVGQVLNRSIVTMATPPLARAAAKGDFAEFGVLLRHAAQKIAIATTLALVGFILVGLVLLASFPPSVLAIKKSDALLIVALILALVGLLYGDPLGNLAMGGFYARGATRTPALLAGLAFTIGGALRIAGFSLLGIFGLAAAVSVGYLLKMLALHIALRKSIDRLTQGTS